MVEKLKNYFSEILFGLFFILLLGFLALPFLDVELLMEMNGEEAVTKVIPLSIYALVSGGTFGMSTLRPDGTFILILIMILMAGLLFALSHVISKKKARNAMNGMALVCLITVAVLMIVSEKILESYDYLKGWTEPYIEMIHGSDFHVLGFALDLICVIALAVILAMSFFKDVKFSVQEMAEMAMLIAVALVLDKVKIQVGATGGSINLAGIPLFLIALRHGPLKTFVASSIIFGLISCVIDGYGLQTFPFDYFIAFSGYMVTAIAYNLFKKYIVSKKDSKGVDLGCMIASLVIGAVAVMFTRMIGSSLSSYLYFMDYLDGDLLAKVGNDKFKAILLYNILYIGPSAAVSMAAAILLAKPMQMINARFPIKNEGEEIAAEPDSIQD